MTLNNLFNLLLATVLMFFRATVWIFLAVSIYFSVLWLSIEFRGLVFEHLCTPPLKRELIDGRLDWCETWWWHPYRLSIQLIFGSLTALIVMATAWVLLTKRRWVLVSAAVFMIVGAILHTYYFAAVEIFRNNTSTACLYGWYREDRTVEDCRRLLGPFGDLRFYYPGTVALLSLTLALRFGKSRVSTVKEIPVQ